MFLLSGCMTIGPAKSTKNYSTMTAMSAVEYTTFISKEIATVNNQLVTRLSMATSVLDGTYDPVKEKQNAEESLEKVSAVIDEVTVTMPAKTYGTDRQNTLDLMNDAKVALEEYILALDQNDVLMISTCVSDFKATCIALSGEANADYQ